MNTAFTFTIYRLVFSGTWWSTSFSLKHNHQLLMFKRNWNNILFRSMIFQGHLNKIVTGFLLIECTNVLKYPYFFHPNHWFNEIVVWYCRTNSMQLQNGIYDEIIQRVFVGYQLWHKTKYLHFCTYRLF